jgi:hypothetical protein
MIPLACLYASVRVTNNCSRLLVDSLEIPAYNYAMISASALTRESTNPRDGIANCSSGTVKGNAYIRRTLLAWLNE